MAKGEFEDALVTPEFLDLVIQHKAETYSLDHKGPLAWDGDVVSAKLAKAAMAFANSGTSNTG
jgi:hypothetical protein